MPHDVFISYSSTDSIAAQAVCKAIELSGMPCWIAPRDISPGREWSGEIIDALNACRAIVLIFSSSSNDSPQVIREVERGVNKRLPILVFRIEDTPLSKAMEYFLSVPHWFDAHSGPIETHLPPLTQGLAQLLGKMAPEPAPEPSPVVSPLENLPREVTFLFTDIEGSTKLWESYPEQMQQVLSQHDTFLREAIVSQGGHVFKTIGDAFCAVFASAEGALEAALRAQYNVSTLLVEDKPLKVRMALHTGWAERRDGDFFGPSLNRVARLLAVGHGGQVLLSKATRELLPSTDSFLDLGMHRLKDLQQPEHICQANTTPFPPLRSLSLYDNNLPQQVTSFVGREKELKEIKERLATTALLTLTGSGGTGKTRLSLQVAAEVLEQFPDGVWLVELAPLSDPSLVPQTVAEVLGIAEIPGEPITKTLVAALKERNLLLVLDNGEHVLDACARVVEALLRSCPKVQVLISSREPLGIMGELAYRVPSLALPQPGTDYTPETLVSFEAVRLFVDRAQIAKPDFVVTAANVPVLVQVSQQLEGIPLAIELAAARIRSMSIESLATRLADRFRILTGGSRAALPRQQTLRALIDWSYDLLEENQKALLCRLSVFAGGWTLEAAEGVCSGSGFPPAAETATPNNGGKGGLGQGGTLIEDWEMLDLLTALHDKSLLVYEEVEGEARYRLLETLRQYARERLLESGESEAFRDRHLAYFLSFGEKAGTQLWGADQKFWYARLDLEHENLRAALDWGTESLKGAESALRLAGLIWWLWMVRGYFKEGRERLAQVLAATPNADPWTRAQALNGAGALAFDQGDYSEARRFHEQGLAIKRELGDRWGIAVSLNDLGIVAYHQGDYSVAQALNEESLIIKREFGDQQGVAYSLASLGLLAYHQRDFVKARAFYEESLALRRKLESQRGIGSSLVGLGNVIREQGDSETARALYEESLPIFREVGDRLGIASSLEGLAALAEPLLAARLWGAAERLREELGSPLTPTERADQEQRVAAARAAAGEEAFAAAWAQGREK